MPVQSTLQTGQCDVVQEGEGEFQPPLQWETWCLCLVSLQVVLLQRQERPTWSKRSHQHLRKKEDACVRHI